MSDSLITRKEHSHNTPLHYGYRKDFNDLLNSFFNGWLELPTESAAFKNMEPKIEVAENENDVPSVPSFREFRKKMLTWKSLPMVI